MAKVRFTGICVGGPNDGKELTLGGRMGAAREAGRKVGHYLFRGQKWIWHPFSKKGKPKE